MCRFLNELLKRKDEYCFPVTITKKQAEYLLSINTSENREQKTNLINKYRLLMDAGKWETRIGSFIGLSYFDGDLTDGQHRLTAFLNSKLDTLTTFVCFG